MAAGLLYTKSILQEVSCLKPFPHLQKQSVFVVFKKQSCESKAMFENLMFLNISSMFPFFSFSVSDKCKHLQKTSEAQTMHTMYVYIKK